MNTHAAALVLLLATSIIARADNSISNADFSTGLDHWYGDARTPADFAPSDPFAKPDPFLSQGAILPLKDRDWVKLSQDFSSKQPSLNLTVTFKLSPDLAFSTAPGDYTGVPAHIGYGYQPFNIKPGNWLIFLADLDGTHGTYFYLKPKPGSDPQTFRGKIDGLVDGDKILCLAFPPGTGKVVILNVSLTDQPGDSSAPPVSPTQ